MEEFSILAGADGFKLVLTQVWDFPGRTVYPSGYSTESTLHIWSGGFKAEGTIYITTGEIFSFYEQLEQAYNFLSGSATLSCFDGDFILTLSFRDRGHFAIEGAFGDARQYSNRLQFEMEAEQTYLAQTLKELRLIVDKYGGHNGKSPLNTGA